MNTNLIYNIERSRQTSGYPNKGNTFRRSGVKPRNQRVEQAVRLFLMQRFYPLRKTR